MVTEDIKPAYYGYFASFADFKDKRFKVVIDTANAMGVLELPIYEQFRENLDIVNLYNDLDHAFQCHEANPLKLETLDELRAKVRETKADLGIAYDGDADRIGLMGGVLARTAKIEAAYGQNFREQFAGVATDFDRAIESILSSLGLLKNQTLGRHS